MNCGEEALRLAAGRRFGGNQNEGPVVGSARIVSATWRPRRGKPRRRANGLAGKNITVETAEAAGKAAVEGAQPLSQQYLQSDAGQNRGQAGVAGGAK